MMSPNAAIREAIKIAYLGGNRCAPNPLVGCVILDRFGKLLSKGFHAKFGQAHAEINALDQIGINQLKGASIFVTLEPCSHQGKTGSCAKFISKLPIAKVYYGMLDPNPQVAGRGIEILKSAGIECEEFAKKDARLKELLQIFLSNLKKQAHITLKMAASLDGVIADYQGQSQWITAEDARENVHFHRARYNAVAIGRQTLETDDPKLNIRHANYPGFQNKVIVFDRKLECLDSIREKQIYKLRNPEEILILHETSLPAKHCEKSGVRLLQRGENLRQLLYENEIYSVFVEGGAGLWQDFLESGEFDSFYLYQSHSILGQKGAKTWSADLQFSLSDRLKLQKLYFQNFQNDLMLSFQKENL